MDTSKNLISRIPKEVSYIVDTLERAGFEAYLVGGCVRDLSMGIEPKDWDITTNAKPEQIIGIFKKTTYENTFGTVGVCVPHETSLENVSPETREYKIIEVTPYRIEAKYSDLRHPDEVKFSDKLEDDLKRRDFTINAMAFNSKGHLVDLFGGLKDIKDKTLRTVGEPDNRLREDALRMLRAVRLSLQLNFSVSYETSQSILKNSVLIKKISGERIHDEFIKIIMSRSPAAGMVMLQKFGLLKNIIPELEEEIGCLQLGEHIYDVWEHSLAALGYAADKNWPLEIRLAALFHDIGKPQTRRLASSVRYRPRAIKGVLPDRSQKYAGGARKEFTFYGHEVIGARMAKKIMERLKFSKKEIDFVEKLVRNHMFFSDTELITLSAVRRIIVKMGPADTPPPHKATGGHSETLAEEKGNHPIWDLMKVRECDRVGMKKKETPYRLRKYFAMIEEALRDPISVNQLKIDGNFMQKELDIPPGSRMGWILHALLEEVMDDPSKNTVEHLSALAQSLNVLGDTELKTLGLRGKEKKEELEGAEVAKLHEKHGVRK